MIVMMKIPITDQEEVCDGRDNNCDGLIDDEDPNISISTYYLDEDGDGFYAKSNPS